MIFFTPHNMNKALCFRSILMVGKNLERGMDCCKLVHLLIKLNEVLVSTSIPISNAQEAQMEN